MNRFYSFLTRKVVFVILLLLSSTALMAQYPEITADANTVVLDHFNQSSSGTVRTQLNYATSLSGLGQAANISNQNFVMYPFSKDLTSAATIEFWIKPESYDMGLVCINWGTTTSAPSAGYVFHSSINPEGKIRISSWNGQGGGLLVGNTVLPLNTWTHVAISWGTTTKIYINGKIDGQMTGVFNPSASGSCIYLPYWGSSKSVTIDEFHVSNIQRTDAEIASRIPVFFNETQSDANTLILDHFNQSSTGTAKNTLNYTDGLNGLGQAANITNKNFIMYPFNKDLTNAATIEFWIKPEYYDFGLVCINWGTTTSVPSAGYVFHSSINPEGKIRISSWNGQGGGLLVGNTVLPLNTWTHVAISWGTTTKIYINGKIDNQMTGVFNPSAWGSCIYLPYWGNDNPVTIDEFHVSNI